MDQTSLFDIMPVVPETYEDIDSLLEQVREDDAEEDLFRVRKTSTGRSYSFYGTKVFEFQAKKDDETPSRMKVSADVAAALGQGADAPEKGTFLKIDLKDGQDAEKLTEALKAKKRRIFRGLSAGTFSCCDDFLRCSDAKECVHPKDRTCNGCLYRNNLEQGRIFYGKNRNID